jgi:Fe-S oxidoreductase
MTDQQAVVDLLRKRIDQPMLAYLEVCARCGACAQACHMHGETREPLHSPGVKAELVRRVYRRHFTLAGRLLPWASRAREVDDAVLDEFSKAAYECTGCRRCTTYCPLGIDVTWMMSALKHISAANGRTPEVLLELADMQIEKGENIGLYRDLIAEQMAELEKQVQEELADASATLPVDKANAEMLYVALAGAHSILPAAKVFHAAKASWTLSLFDAPNWGYFTGDPDRAKAVASRVIEEGKRLGVRKVVLGECGHSYRVLKYLADKWLNTEYPFEVVSIVEVLAGYLRTGLIKVDPARNATPLTYHDPCQLGRNGGVLEEPRLVLRETVQDFREMTPNRHENWCCGGGGGLVAVPEMTELRLKTGRNKADQIRRTGAKMVVTECENCRLQLSDLNEHYALGVEVKSLLELVASSLVLERGAGDEPRI